MSASISPSTRAPSPEGDASPTEAAQRIAESFMEEMKRYVRFGPDDEAALRAFHGEALPHFRRIAEEFYDRLLPHDEARAVFSGPDQVERLKGTLCDWMNLLFTGPWGEEYYERRARIGRIHVRIGLAQRYMFSAMNVIRLALTRIAADRFSDDEERRLATVVAIAKILDIELAIMLETYRESFVDKVQHVERLEKTLLQDRLALSEARYDEIVEKGEALIVTTDAQWRVLLFNRRCEILTGISRAQAAERTWLDVFVPDEQRPVMAQLGTAILKGERVAPFEGAVLSPQGERWVRWHFTTLPGPEGAILCAMGLDVTEEHDLAIRTRRAERFAALGTMAAGLAHELRNPLNAAHLQLTLVQRRLARTGQADSDGTLQAAQLAAGEMKRLGSLVEEFLQFARPQPLRLARADLRGTAETVVAFTLPEAEQKGVRLVLAKGEAAVTDFDDERMKQVLHNLIRNALEAVPTVSGLVQIRVGVHDREVLLEVEDNGPGLPSKDAPVFEPFFTTKSTGTGLGLSIVHRIVVDHGGRVTVDSRPGRTVFGVWLPRTPV